jgi:hypothetical protein
MAWPSRLPAEEAVKPMMQAAQRFLALLDAEQEKEAHFAWEDAKRTAWHYLPDHSIKPDGRRYGLRLDKMKPDQRAMAEGLLASALSARGVLEANTIRVFEQLLHDMENQNPRRNPEFYYVSIFGKPAPDEDWSWRFEGHHLSVNITIAQGKHISATPSFFASNPGLVQEGSLKGLKLLADEEDMARALVTSMTDQQKQKAIILEKAPRDIFTAENQSVDRAVFQEARGIAYADLNSDQQKQLLNLVSVFTGKYRPALLNNINEQGPVNDTASMYFAWAGGLDDGQGHYYRIQTEHHLLEYDNVQNGAHHVHAVWREFDGDFGEDLLGRHHREQHTP